jgi:purine nucleosidase
MSKTPLIFDCDPGDDDAVALLVTMTRLDEFDLLGITTVAGNTAVHHTYQNALKVRALAKHTEIPVYQGCHAPLFRSSLLSVAEFHGDDGLEGQSMLDVKEESTHLHGVDFIINTLKTSAKKVTLFITGPSTNVAVALKKDPSIAANIEQIILMGGSVGCGNITIAAEFNIYADPHALDILLRSGIKITLIPLDVTHQVTFVEEDIETLRSLNTEVGNQVAAFVSHTLKMDQKWYGSKGRNMHDPCVPVYFLHPEYFTVKHCYVSVETQNPDHYGATFISPYPKFHDQRNAYVAVDVEGGKVKNLIIDYLKTYS